jgi:hypothetical protein
MKKKYSQIFTKKLFYTKTQRFCDFLEMHALFFLSIGHAFNWGHKIKKKLCTFV